MTDTMTRVGLTRRQALTALTASGAAAIPFGAQAQPAAASRLLPGANVCVLTPEAEEGPFYFDPKLERVDITEGKQGVPLGLVLQVVEAADCVPVKGARVDVWHADALGYYSGYRGQSDAHNVSTKGDTFLRGTQFCDDAGLVKFATIYPGWYQGRTTHIHCKVYLAGKAVLTTQLYFPDALSEYLYKNVKPYNARVHERDTVNATDHVVENSGSDHASFCSIKEEPDRYLASLIVGVDRNAKPSTQRGPMGPPPDGPPPQGMGPPRAASGAKRRLVPGVVTSK
jgi:protocatechuate 3,4-dioxygenase beta subunit